MSSTLAPTESSIERRTRGHNVWLRRAGVDERAELLAHTPHALKYEVLESEEAVGRAMLGELFGQSSSLEQTCKSKDESSN